MRGADFMELRAFELVARNASFTKASEELGVSRAALSQSVKALEQRLGVQLLMRTTRSVSLTDAGRELLDRLSPALLTLVSAVDNIDRYRERPTGHVRVVSDRVGAALFLHPSIAEFSAAYPGITQEFAVDSGHDDFVGAGFDGALREDGHIALDMVAVALGRAKRRILVANASYLASRGAPCGAADLETHSCIMVRKAHNVQIANWTFFTGERTTVSNAKPALVVNDEMMAIDSVAARAGIALVIEDLVKDKIESGEFVRVLDDSFAPGPTYRLCYPKHRFQKVAFKTFVNFLRAAAVS
jgi:DNA-binding transcriptional LysR family regulator